MWAHTVGIYYPSRPRVATAHAHPQRGQGAAHGRSSGHYPREMSVANCKDTSTCFIRLQCVQFATHWHQTWMTFLQKR